MEVLKLKIKPRKIFGILTTVAVAGIVVYSVKKYYDSKKQMEESIDVEEAKDIVVRKVYKDAREAVGDVTDEEFDELQRTLNKDQMEEVKFGARDQAHYDPDFVRKDDFVEEERVIAVKPEDVQTGFHEEEEEEVWDETVDPQEIQDSKGYYAEDEDVIDDLRYEPNSADAREQFVNMELANLGRNNDTRDIVSMLYNHPFVPRCDEDQNLKVRLQDHRIKFFGLLSKWNQQITFGDVIMYYGKAAEYNCGQGVIYWVDYFLGCANLNDILLTSDDIDDQIKVLNNHNFYNEDTQSFGIFGLSADQMTEACAIAKSRIDEQVTYDIEFNVFIQGVI